MARLHASTNSRFFGIHDQERFSLFRGPALLWTHPVPGMTEVIRLTNTGDAWFRSPEGVFRLPHAREAKLERIEIACEIAGGSGEEQTRLGGVRVSTEGNEVALERVAPETRLSRKLLKLIRRSSSEGDPAELAEAHEVLVYNRNGGQIRKFFKGLIDPERDQRFHWQMSPNFSFLVAGIPEKKGVMLFKVIHTKEETVYSEFDMKVPDIDGLHVTDQGTVMLDVRVSPEECYLVIKTLDGENHILRPPAGSEILYLGHRLVAMKTSPVPFILVKNYEDALACHADLRPLERLGMQYELFFNERGDIDVVMSRDGELRVHHTDVETLSVDTRRWDLLAQQQESHEQEQQVIASQKEAEQDLRRQRSEEMSQRLATEIPAVRPAPARPPDAPPRSRGEVENEMEKLRMHYVSGSIERSEYLRRNEELALELEAATGPPEPEPLRHAGPDLPRPAAPELTRVPEPPPPPAPEIPARGPQLAWSMPEAMPTIQRMDPREFERQKIERLLESLEERLHLGEVSDFTYRELKEKYLKRLEAAVDG